LLLSPPFFPIILIGSTTLLTGMTGISLYMQWPLTSQSHGSVFFREQLRIKITDQTPRPIPVVQLWLGKARLVSKKIILRYVLFSYQGTYLLRQINLRILKSFSWIRLLWFVKFYFHCWRLSSKLYSVNFQHSKC
jgi:hypothetical protein